MNDPDARARPDERGPATPLHLAAVRNDAPAIRELAARGMLSAINARDEFGQTPLHSAVFGGCEDAVVALLELGADPNLVNGFGVPPLWTAEDDFGLERIAAILRQHGGTKG